MNWVTFIWAGVIAACATMALPHLLVGLKERAPQNLFFVFTALCVAGFATGELAMMHARTIADIGRAHQLTYIPLFLLNVSIAGFVYLYFGTGRLWLASAAILARFVGLVINFTFPPNVNFREITGVRLSEFLGQTVATEQGIISPCTRIGELSSLLLIIFVIDASVRLWRRGGADGRRRAAVIGGSIALHILAATGVTVLIHLKVLHTPYFVSLTFLGVVLAMNYELSSDILRAAKVSRELRESELRADITADAAGLGLWVWEFARDEIWATPRCRSILGFGSDERITFADLLTRVHVDDRDATERKVRLAVERCESYEGQYRLALPTDSERWIGTTGRVQCNESGAAWRMHSVVREITERHRAQKEAELLRQEIAHVGRVSMMGQLAAALAHEINQPLGAILRNTEAAELFLQHTSPDLGEIRAILADIRQDDQRAGAVIERMRTMMKGHALETRTLNVADLLEEVARLTRGDATARKVRLDVDVPNGLLPVQGDRVHLQQVLLNLILNSMDALNGAGPHDRRVAVSARRNDAQTIEIAVRDWGHGIPAEQLAHVFDPFFTTKPTGMGMGLPISRTIIEAHGGELWATNNEDRGVTFRFTLKTAPEGPAS